MPLRVWLMGKRYEELSGMMAMFSILVEIWVILVYSHLSKLWMISWNFCIPAFKNTCKQNWTIVNDIHSNILVIDILEWGVTLPSLSGVEFPEKSRARGKENKTLRTAPKWNCYVTTPSILGRFSLAFDNSFHVAESFFTFFCFVILCFAGRIFFCFLN